jgi:hypothetical protein
MAFPVQDYEEAARMSSGWKIFTTDHDSCNMVRCWWSNFMRQPEAVLSVRLSQDDVGITWNLRAQDQQTDDQNGQFHLLVSLQLNNCSQQHT